jgi:gluconolactonase
MRPGRRSEQIAQLPDGHVPDGLKVAANGDLWITAFMAGGLDILAPDGTHKGFLETGGVPLNCVFGRGALYVVDFGEITAVTDAAPMGGRLWRVDVDVEGMPLFRGAIG